jgi:nucleoside-diphosphate-sugar epimerase
MKKISFDFDGTINDHFDGGLNPFKVDVHNVIKRLVNEGYDVHIVTRRYGDPNLNENQIVFDIADNVGINKENIHFTDRKWKFNIINELGIDFHIDDDESDIRFIDFHCKDCVGFHLGKKGPEGFYELITE